MIYACMCIRMTLDSSQAPQAPADHLMDVAECTFTVDFIWYTLLAMGLNSFCLHDLRNSSMLRFNEMLEKSLMNRQRSI